MLLFREYLNLFVSLRLVLTLLLLHSPKIVWKRFLIDTNWIHFFQAKSLKKHIS